MLCPYHCIYIKKEEEEEEGKEREEGKEEEDELARNWIVMPCQPC